MINVDTRDLVDSIYDTLREDYSSSLYKSHMIESDKREACDDYNKWIYDFEGLTYIRVPGNEMLYRKIGNKSIT
jgi:hypothetical protein